MKKPQILYIIFMPKFHCKLAGEGIKYSWEHSNFMTGDCLCQKKNKHPGNFIDFGIVFIGQGNTN